MTTQATPTAPVVIIGAGLGGLAAAIRLAAAGHNVTVLERQAGAGGKAGVSEHDGVTFDTGPSVLTMRSVWDRLLAPLNRQLSDLVTLTEPALPFLYVWPDGTRLPVAARWEETRECVHEVFGAADLDELDRFMAYASRIWENAAPHFVFSPAPSMGQIMRLGFQGLRAVSAIDPMRSMFAAIRSQVRNPCLQDVLLRYATYNGSDPRRAPATLCCIAHVELVEGAWGVAGGIGALIDALRSEAERLGVLFCFDSPAEAIEIQEGRVRAVRVHGESMPARAVVANTDVAELCGSLLPAPAGERLRPNATPSMSGYNLMLRMTRPPQHAHTVLFGHPYLREFEDIFDRETPPTDPTVYLCNQTLAHDRAGWPDASPVFAMANAPAIADSGPPPAATWATLQERMLARMAKAGFPATANDVVWERNPADLAALYPGSRGSIYGAASNDRFAAFRRPHNAPSHVPGLFLASGSAHPGGGMPLCIQSGIAASDAAQHWLERSA